MADARSTARNILLMVVTVILFFGLLEVGLRLSGRIPTNTLRSPDRETLAAIPGIFEPDQDFVDLMIPELAYRIRTNSLGFRGPEFARRKPEGTTRILCVGDSYTLGPYVEDDATMPATLERLLNEGGRGRFEVVNGGVNGFSIIDEHRFLQQKALSIDPDLVLVMFSQNDIRDLLRKRPTIELMAEHAGTKALPVVGPAVRALQRTATFNGMQRLAAWLRVRRRNAAVAGLSPEQEQRLWEAYRGHLASLDSLLRERGIPWLFVVWPSARQIDGEDDLSPQEKLGALAEGLGIPILDLTPEIAALDAEGGKAFLVPLDGHPAPASYDRAARAIRDRLAGSILSKKAARP